MARVHRIGQTKPVHVYRLCTEGTIEERIQRRADSKLYLDQMVNRGSTAQAQALEVRVFLLCSALLFLGFVVCALSLAPRSSRRSFRSLTKKTDTLAPSSLPPPQHYTPTPTSTYTPTKTKHKTKHIYTPTKRKHKNTKQKHDKRPSPSAS
jgi:hypothetical protein